MTRKKPSLADIRANKGKYQYSKLHVDNWEEIIAAEAAGIDILSVPPPFLTSPRFREVAPTVFAIPGLSLYDHDGTPDGFLRWGYEMMRAGADAVYCPTSFSTIRRMADEAIPVIGHVGLIPSKCSWTGGFKAVGKTAESALEVWDMVKKYEDAGAFGAEIEVMPPDIAAEIARRTPLFMISMGSGTGCDAQYLFTCDVLGENSGHIPKHAKVYRNFAAERERLQQERIAAFKEFHRDVQTSAFPEAAQVIAALPGEVEKFRAMLAKSGARERVS
jgi:3-methyl-2-oxobutanoate hydroxymethyltransferase